MKQQDIKATDDVCLARQSDCLSMLWSDVADGAISVVQQKTGKKLCIPMHRDLQAVLDLMPRRAITVLSSTLGKPWTRRVQDLQGKELERMGPLKVLVFHGLRKSTVVFLLEAGCTDAEVSAITGQSRKMVDKASPEWLELSERTKGAIGPPIAEKSHCAKLPSRMGFGSKLKIPNFSTATTLKKLAKLPGLHRGSSQTLSLKRFPTDPQCLAPSFLFEPEKLQSAQF